MQQPLKVGKGKETDVPLESPKGTQPCRHLDVFPARFVSDF